MKSLRDAIGEIPGYKIPDSHFKIGSKIHVSEFYYAKRFFQNGFFASRVAFELARAITIDIQKSGILGTLKEEGLTIVGNEMYSELLVSILAKFLRSKWKMPVQKLNHNIFEDDGTNALTKKTEFNKNILLVVPIASTFSTALKLENALLGLSNDLNIIKPFYNVLYVYDRNSDRASVSTIEEKFGWKSKSFDQKIITTKDVYALNNEPRVQKFLFSIPTTWHDISDCKYCYSKRQNCFRLEKPLYQTDKSNVTPTVIFGFPYGRNFSTSERSRRYVLSGDMLYYGYHQRNHAHFLSSVDTERFLLKNHEAVKKWLFGLRERMINKGQYVITDKVILISPSHFSNANFLGLVNEVLFRGSANILHYDSSNEYIQNFDLIYGKELKEANRVYFVDDSLKSGNSFYNIFRFVESSKNGSLNRGRKPIDGCIFLINKSQPHVYGHIKNLLPENRVFSSFANLHFYNAIKDYQYPPILFEKRRYEELVKKSNLDVLKIQFGFKVNKIRPLKKGLGGDKRDSIKKARHRLLIIASHRIVEYFTLEPNPKLDSFFEFMNDLGKKVSNQIEGYEEPIAFNNMDGDIPKSYIKALTQLPFVQYMPLRDSVFKWLLSLIEIQIGLIRNVLDKDGLSYEQFETLAFLIRRLCLMNSNILISPFFLTFLEDLYGPGGIPTLIDEMQGDILENMYSYDKISNLKTFDLFYVVQIKELLQRNEHRSLILEQNLKLISNTKNPHIKQIVKALREENDDLIRAYKYLRALEDWKSVCYTAKIDEFEYKNDRIIKLLEKETIIKHPRYLRLNKFLTESGEPPICQNTTFQNFLWLVNFFDFEGSKDISLSQKTELIFSKLFDMFKSIGINQLGGFLLILDNKLVNWEREIGSVNNSLTKKEGLFVAYNQDSGDFNGIGPSKFYGDDNGYLIEFLFGRGILGSNPKNEQKYKRTIVELELYQGEWRDLYQGAHADNEIKIEPSLLNNHGKNGFNRLFLIQISKTDSNDWTHRKPQGLIGFYYHLENGALNPRLVQYLLILREFFSEFISSHHENDEFRDWRIASIKQKTSLLTGHGRDMLMRLTPNAPEFKGIIETLLLLQRFVIDKRNEKEIPGIQGSQIMEIFNKHLKSKIADEISGGTIDKSFFEDIMKMAKRIYGLAAIENPEDLEEPIKLNLAPYQPFTFDKDILRMICFEILLNAKKNRWIFLTDEAIVGNDGKTYEKNVLEFEVTTMENVLGIIIKNTGPIRNFEMERLNSRTIKRIENISGIELIRSFLDEFKLGTLEFLPPTILNDQMDFGMVQIKLTIKKTGLI